MADEQAQEPRQQIEPRFVIASQTKRISSQAEELIMQGAFIEQLMDHIRTLESELDGIRTAAEKENHGPESQAGGTDGGDTSAGTEGS